MIVTVPLWSPDSWGCQLLPAAAAAELAVFAAAAVAALAAAVVYPGSAAEGPRRRPECRWRCGQSGRPGAPAAAAGPAGGTP